MAPLPKVKVLAGPEADEGSMVRPQFEVVSSPEGGTPLLATKERSGLTGAWHEADYEARKEWLQAVNALEAHQSKINIPGLGSGDGGGGLSEDMLDALKSGRIKVEGGNDELIRLAKAVDEAHKKWNFAGREGVSTARRAEKEYKHQTAEQVDPSHVTETVVVDPEEAALEEFMTEQKGKLEKK